MPPIDDTHPRRHCMIVFAPYPLGETRVQREAEALIKHGYGVDVIAIGLPGEPIQDEYKGVKIYREKYRLPGFFSKGSGLLVKFLKYIRFFFNAGYRVTQLNRRNHYSSIQVHNLPDFLVFCALLPKLQGVPVLLDLHDLMPEFYSGRFGQGNSFAARLIRLQERLACRFADHVITVSEHWRQALIRRGVPETKCSVVMNLADESIFTPSTRSEVQPDQNGSFRLIYHGAIVDRYGLDLAVKAVDLVKGEIPGIHLSLIGRGEFLPRIIQMVKELHLERHVSIEDLHIAEELPQMICACHLGIVPYQNDVFTDGLLPTKLMEYAALGLPAVAARTTAIKAYFSDANTEFFEPGNVDDLARCITLLYHNPDRLAELARGSENFNRRYNWARISEEYVALVDRLNGSAPK